MYVHTDTEQGQRVFIVIYYNLLIKKSTCAVGTVVDGAVDVAGAVVVEGGRLSLEEKKPLKEEKKYFKEGYLKRMSLIEADRHNIEREREKEREREAHILAYRSR